MDEQTFRKKLAALINEYSLEGGSDTPDFILAGYLMACLSAFDAATIRRAAFARTDRAKGAGGFSYQRPRVAKPRGGA